MEAHEFAKKIYMSGEASSARSVLEGLRHKGTVDFPDEVLQAAAAFGTGLGGICSCLIAAAMAVGISAAKSQKSGAKSLDAEKISSEIIEEFRSRYKTTRCSDIISGYPDFSTEDRKRSCAEIVEFTTRITADLLAKQEIVRETFNLTRFIDYLNRIPQSELTIEKVIPLMERVQIRHDEIKKCLVFSEESYARNLFYKNDRYEILVMCWDKGQVSPIHDHDQSYSVEKIYSGNILCTNYRRTEPRSDSIEETDSSLAEEGSVISGRRGDIHRIANTDPNLRAVSIHFYSPPLKRMKAFSLDGKEGQWMKLRYLYIYRPEVWQSLESCNL